MSTFYWSDELYHHGILGQKWGVRRYQNPDGSMTEAGKKRYLRNGKNEVTKSDAYNKAKERLAKTDIKPKDMHDDKHRKETKEHVNGILKDTKKDRQIKNYGATIGSYVKAALIEAMAGSKASDQYMARTFARNGRLSRRNSYSRMQEARRKR